MSIGRRFPFPVSHFGHGNRPCNDLVDIVEQIASIRLERSYKLDAPKGVDGRSSDNTMILDRLGWAPSTPLRDVIEKTYAWIHDQ